MTQDQNSDRARIIRGNRRARGFNREDKNASTFQAVETPRWLQVTAAAAVFMAVIALYFMFFGSDDGNDALLSSAPDLVVGTCFDASSELWVDTIETRNCFEPHVAEVTGAVDLSAEFVEYPLLDDLRRQAERDCAGDLRLRFVQPNGEDLLMGASVPTASDWAAGRRVALCSLIATDGSLLEAPVELLPAVE